jgi:uncharacterized iron-regulated membrane protein
MKKGFVFLVHRFAGLVSGLFILLMSLSGAVLVFHEELETLQYPEIIADGNQPILPVDSCYGHLQKQYPHAQISDCQVAERPDRPFLFTIYDSSYKKGTEALRVYIHPQTGVILKTNGAKANILNWLVVLHNSFHLGKKGEWLLGFFALVFLISIVTGTILYRRNIGAVLSFKKRVFKKANLHQLIGVWALVFNLMIAITGSWMQRYVFKKDFYIAGNYTPVLKTSPVLFYSLDSSVNKLKQKFPDFTAYVIYFAQSKKGKMAIYGSRSSNSFIHSKKYADVIFLDSTGQVARTAFVNDISSSARYDIINSQVHFGKYGGWPVKLAYSLLGLTGGVLSITGFLLWVKRKGKEM